MACLIDFDTKVKDTVLSLKLDSATVLKLHAEGLTTVLIWHNIGDTRKERVVACAREMLPRRT